MSKDSCTYSLTASSGKLYVYTFKEGLLSAIAHDLLIDVTNFKLNLNIPGNGSSAASIDAEIQADSLKVICAMKDGQRQLGTLRDKEKADIEKTITKDVLHSKRYPTINFRSDNIQVKGGACHVNGELTLHGTVKAVEFDLEITNGNNIKGMFTLLQKDYGVKPYRAMFGAVKVKNAINIAIDLFISQTLKTVKI